MNSGALKIGVMSFAHLHAAGFTSGLVGRPGVEVRIADEDPERGQKYADQFGVPFAGSYEALLDWAPDAVMVCSENAGHRKLVELAAGAGAYVLCEKPLATTLSDGRQMLEACERAGVELMTAFPMRFAPPIAEFAERVRGGALGTLLGGEGINFGTNPGGWFVDPQQAGGGSVMDHTVHIADLLRWILGCEAVEVYAQSNSILYPELPVETAGLIAVTFSNGVVATIDCSWSRPRAYPTWGAVKLELVGENGVAGVDAYRQKIGVYTDGPKRGGPYDTRWLPFTGDSTAGMLDEFLAAVRERRTPHPSGWDGYRATEIAIGAYRSAESGQPVALPLEV